MPVRQIRKHINTHKKYNHTKKSIMSGGTRRKHLSHPMLPTHTTRSALSTHTTHPSRQSCQMGGDPGRMALPPAYFGNGTSGYHSDGSTDLIIDPKQRVASQGMVYGNFAGPNMYPSIGGGDCGCNSKHAYGGGNSKLRLKGCKCPASCKCRSTSCKCCTGKCKCRSGKCKCSSGSCECCSGRCKCIGECKCNSKSSKKRNSKSSKRK